MDLFSKIIGTATAIGAAAAATASSYLYSNNSPISTESDDQVIDQSCSEEPFLDEDVARESAKIAEGQQINDPLHQECQDPLDVVFDSVTDFQAEADQNITSNNIPEGPENMILKQKIIELEKERDALKKLAEEKDDWKKLALSIMPLHCSGILRGHIEETFSLLRPWYGPVIPAPPQRYTGWTWTTQYPNGNGYKIPDVVFADYLRSVLQAQQSNPPFDQRVQLLLEERLGHSANATEIRDFRIQLDDMLRHLRDDYSALSNTIHNWPRQQNCIDMYETSAKNWPMQSRPGNISATEKEIRNAVSLYYADWYNSRIRADSDDMLFYMLEAFEINNALRRLLGI